MSIRARAATDGLEQNPIDTSFVRKVDAWLCGEQGIFAAFLTVTAVIDAAAQSYPVRPVRFIVPFSPSGESDTAARIIGQKLGERWGQQTDCDARWAQPLCAGT